MKRFSRPVPSNRGFTPHHFQKFLRRIGLLPRTSNTKSGAGFTLIEVIIAMGVFTMAMTMAITVFVLFVQQQRRTVVQQELQNDSRAVIEQIAQDLREGQAYYPYYETNFSGSFHLLENALDGKDPGNYLVILTTMNEEVRYRLSSNKLQRCVVTSTVFCTSLTPTDWADISPGTLTVESFSFLIRPSENPFDSRSPVSCGTTAAPSEVACETSTRWGSRCTDSVTNACLLARIDTCYCVPQMYGDVLPLHPTVTFSLKMRRNAGQLTVAQTFQTTVASRQFINLDKLNAYAP